MALARHQNWQHVRNVSRPDLWIWLGDNVYQGRESKSYKNMGKFLQCNGLLETGLIIIIFRRLMAEPKIPVTGKIVFLISVQIY